MEQERDEQGKFIQLGEEKRIVRSVRLTDSLWKKIGETAKQRCITRTDLIEEMLIAEDSQVNLNETIKILEEALKLKPNAGGAIKTKIREALKKIQESM